MDNSIAVQVLNGQNSLCKVESGRVWRQSSNVFEQSGAVSTLDVFHHQTKMFLNQEIEFSGIIKQRFQKLTLVSKLQNMLTTNGLSVKLIMSLSAKT